MSAIRLVRTALVALGVAAALPGCVASSATTCDNLVCPTGTTCSPAGGRCVDVDLVDACLHAADGQSCSVAGLPPATCQSGICQASRCGDGRVSGGEQCDGGNLAGQTCTTLGLSGSGLACSPLCKFDTAKCGRCGDGIRNGNEQCDGSDLGKATCLTLGFHNATKLGCNANCTFDTSQCTGGRCGDGVRNGLEQCDGKDMGGVTCKKLGYDFTLNGLACTSSCTFSAKSCRCSAGERCLLATQTCECSKYGCSCVDKPKQ